MISKILLIILAQFLQIIIENNCIFPIKTTWRKWYVLFVWHDTSVNGNVTFAHIMTFHRVSPHGTFDSDPMRIGDPDLKTTLLPQCLDPDPSCLTVFRDSAWGLIQQVSVPLRRAPLYQRVVWTFWCTPYIMKHCRSTRNQLFECITQSKLHKVPAQSAQNTRNWLAECESKVQVSASNIFYMI